MLIDLTISCTIILPDNAVLSDDKQTFFINNREFILNTITFSTCSEESVEQIADLSITEVEKTLFEAASATTPMTIEKKVSQAVFYVDENKDTYRVDWNDPDDRCFLASDENTGEGFTIDYDSIPADAYFLGTVRL